MNRMKGQGRYCRLQGRTGGRSNSEENEDKEEKKSEKMGGWEGATGNYQNGVPTQLDKLITSNDMGGLLIP